MNRYEEYMELKKELDHTPEELDLTLYKARQRFDHHRKILILWRTPMASLCFLAILFILLVNLFPTAALAMSDIPILKSLIKAVSFDPSLKLAVEHDYVQYVSDTQTKENISVTVDYLIVDANHISLFFHVDSPEKTGIYQFELLDSSGNPLEAIIVSDTSYEADQMEELKIDMAENAEIPDKLIFNIDITQSPLERSQSVSIDSNDFTDRTEASPDDAMEPSVPFHFEITPDQKFTGTMKTAPINQWIDVLGQKIYLDRLEIYPAKTKLIISTDDQNTAAIRDLDISFKDDKGNLYTEKKGGVTATFQPDNTNIGSIWYESSYFALAKQLDLYLTGVSFIEKSKRYGMIDYSNQTITNIPDGVTVVDMELKHNTLAFTLRTKSMSELLSSQYFDVDGNTYSFGSYSIDTYNDSQKNLICNAHYQIKDYIDGKYKIQWNYATEKELEEPMIISVNLE